jgi:hypothetical protein
MDELRAYQLVGLFRSRKKEIHIKIKQDFGCEQYEKKLLGLIGMINAT